VVAVCVTGVFVMLLTTHYLVAGAFTAIAALALAAWHWQEPVNA
jgi:hypothetical protein